MNPLLFAGIALALVLLLVVIVTAARRRKPVAARYVLRDALLTPAERAFHAAIDAAIGAQYRLFAMVRVADVLVVETADQSLRQAAFNRIRAKHFDFIVCAPDTLKPLLAIELNDATHQRPDRQQRDAMLREICKDAGLTLLEFTTQRAYKPASLRQQLLTAMGVPDAGPGRREPYAAVPRSALTPPIDTSVGEAEADRVAAAAPPLPQQPAPPALEISAAAAPAMARREPVLQASAAPAAPRCPKCDGEMQRRRLATGQLAGREFWLCRRFPSCSGLRPVGAGEPGAPAPGAH